MAPKVKECGICIENFNQSNRKPIVCLHCDFEACASCCSRVLLDSSNDPQCMQCAKAWSKDFLVENFTKKFVNETLKKHRENQLYEREQAMLPATQPVVERELEKEKLQEERSKVAEEKKKLKKQIEELTTQLANLDYKIYRVDARPAAEIMEKEKRQFVRRCPVDDCMGFLSTAWKCGLCNTWTCPDCHEPKGQQKDAEHTCKPENVETAKLLARDTKPCPKCAVPIHKVFGCNQMFCTSCHTPWNWQTGKIENGPIHNPHYFEMRNRLGDAFQPNLPAEDPCGNNPIPTTTQINNALRKFGNLTANNLQGTDLTRYIMWITHMHEVERRRYLTDNINDNLDLRVKFMMKKIDETRFKQLLQQREKARAKRREIEQIYTSAYHLSGDIIRNMMAATAEAELTKGLKELRKLLKYSREGLANIANKYGGKVPEFEYDFKVTTPLPYNYRYRFGGY